MHKIKIANLANIMGVALLAGFFAVVGIGYYSVEKLKVGGPYYTRMINGKDLIADVLPPPLYIIEPFLEASHLVMDPANLASHRQQLAELRKAYDTQLKRWQGETDIEPAVRDAVVINAHKEALVFWDALDSKLYPAAEKNDRAALDAAFVVLNRAYDAQRKQVDKAVELATAMNDKTAVEAASAETTIMAVVAIVGLGVLGLVIASIGGVILGLVRPIKHMQDIMHRLAGGDRHVDVPFLTRGDEMGDMARSVEVFKQALVEQERMERASDEAEARAVEERRRQRLELADRFERAVGAIVQTVASASSQLSGTASTLTRTAEETSAQSHVVLSASEAAASNVEAVASAAEQLSGSIREIAVQVQNTSSKASQAADEAVRTTGQMNALADAAQKIGGIIELINEIASQTNLLALNATIEAARAGESGRGFAVVSSEVKQLAERTAKATGEIAAQITSIQNYISEAALCIDGITSTIGNLNDASGAIATAVEEQGSVTQEIARNIHHASDGTSEVTRNIRTVQGSAEASSSAAAQLLGAARDLSHQADQLQREVRSFLQEVRAA